MALMRANIDKRTLAGLTTLDVASFAHGLGGIPDAVFIRYVGTVGASTAWYGINAAIDANNVTVQNIGDKTSPDFEVCTVRFHSLIQ